MLKLEAKTSTGKQSLILPEKWKETNTDTFQRIIRDWDGYDWCQLFSIVSGLPIDYVKESKDGKLEEVFYRCISFILNENPFSENGMQSFTDLPMPERLHFMERSGKTGMWYFIPRHLGRLSIGQAIQARKSLEGVKDTRESLSIITAIYLQPIIDNAKYDHLRAIEIEQDILKMPITDIFPIGFFLLRQLKNNGSWLGIDFDQLIMRTKERLRKLLGLRS